MALIAACSSRSGFSSSCISSFPRGRTVFEVSLARLNNNFAFHAGRCLIRIALFLLSSGDLFVSDIKRVYRYHGAEHKTYLPLKITACGPSADAQKYSTYHPRCGTSFLMTIMLLSIFVYAAFPVQDFGPSLLCA